MRITVWMNQSVNYRDSRVYFCAIRAGTRLRLLWAFSGESAAPAEQTTGLTTKACLRQSIGYHQTAHTRRAADVQSDGQRSSWSRIRAAAAMRTEQAPQRGTSQPCV